MPDTFDAHELGQRAYSIRKTLIDMHFRAHAGHIGGGLSVVDILTYLHAHWMHPSDHVILSKGHAASALYATLFHMGVITPELFDTYYCDGTLLPAHPAPRAIASIPAATGSLGHGLPIAVGMAYACRRIQEKSDRVACVVSDGDCNEGSTWEGALFASHHRLDNLVVVVDANGLQGFGRTSEVLNMEPLAGKWSAFGFETREVDGHDFGQLHEALTAPSTGGPRCVVARTIKGRGVSFMEDKLEWHYLPLSEDQRRMAQQDLDDAWAAHNARSGA